MFADRGFSVLRFNFRGVGRSQGYYDGGPGELADAASALDWLQLQNPDSRYCWIAGVSFGTYIAMQLLMRRPEIDGFICVAPPANIYDFTFLAPCPASGLMVNGDKDRVVPSVSVGELAAKTKVQKGVKIEHAVVPDARIGAGAPGVAGAGSRFRIHRTEARGSVLSASRTAALRRPSQKRAMMSCSPNKCVLRTNSSEKSGRSRVTSAR
jgi:pimeloyl-ACP methyl ester carboxylesterase